MLECIECREEKSLSSLPLFYGKFLLSRLEKGQGLTVANSLRRVLLYEIPAVGMTSVWIRKDSSQLVSPEGKTLSDSDTLNPALNNEFNFEQAHEFSALPGIKESMIEILFNLKSIVFSQNFPYDSAQKALLSFDNFGKKKMHSGVLTAQDLKLPEHLSLIFPDQYIASFTHVFSESRKGPNSESQNSPFVFECTIEKISQNDLTGLGTSSLKGFGVGSALNRSTRNRRILPIDGSVFPVKKVNYTIEHDSFGKELVFLEIWTNGAIHPQQVLDQAIEKMIHLFQKFQVFL